MPTFRYRIAVPGGRVVEKTTLADSRDLLKKQLQSEGNFILEIQKVSGKHFLPIHRSGRRIKEKEFFAFNQEFAVLLRSGLSIVAALDAITEKNDTGELMKLIRDIREDIFSGESLSGAFGKYAHVFTNLYVATLQAGEKSGNIPLSVSRYIGYMKKSSEIRRKVITASVYPLILTVVSVFVLFFLLLYVVPAISETFFQAGTQLPYMTSVLIDFSTGVRNHFAFLLAGLLILSGTAALVKNTDAGGMVLDRLMISFPFFGEMYLYYATARLTRTLSIILAGGVTLPEAVRVSSVVIHNRFLQEKYNGVLKSLKAGGGFSESLATASVLPRLAIRMIGAGESSGALGQVLTDVADFYESEVDIRLSVVTSAIEPGLMVLMGLLIGFIVLALYLPIFQLAGTIG
ncbi:MAG: type II secretion system F family protein [Pseudomonadota bacterium]